MLNLKGNSLNFLTLRAEGIIVQKKTQNYYQLHELAFIQTALD